MTSGVLRKGSDAVNRAERIATVIELRKKGYTLHEVAREMSCCHQTVSNLEKEGLSTYLTPRIEEARALSLERLDYYLRCLDPKIRVGNVRAIEVAVGISTRMGKLLGLDIDRIQIDVRMSTDLDAEIASLTNQLAIDSANTIEGELVSEEWSLI